MKKALLLLHGAIGSAEQLKPLQLQLEERYQVHNLHFPGHGGTGMPDAFSIPSFADFVSRHCKQEGLVDITVFGYSMGGYVGMYLARQQPGLVSRIITLATKFHWDETTAAREIRMLIPEVIGQKLPQFAKTLEERHAPDDWKTVLQKTGVMLAEMGAYNPLLPGDYSEIGCPVLLMLGDRDKMVTLEETVEVYRKLPDAQLAVLPGTPHPMESVDLSMLRFYMERFIG